MRRWTWTLLLALAIPAFPGEGGRDWNPDPFDPAGGEPDQLCTVLADARVRLGPFETAHLGRWSLLIDPGAGNRALLRIAGVEDEREVPLQRFFRRVVIGPVPDGAGPDEEPFHRWILVRQGRVRMIRRFGEPRFVEDELDFDVQFEDLDLSDLDDEERERWIEEYWRRESGMWEAAAEDAAEPAVAKPPSRE